MGQALTLFTLYSAGPGGGEGESNWLGSNAGEDIFSLLLLLIATFCHSKEIINLRKVMLFPPFGGSKRRKKTTTISYSSLEPFWQLERGK